MNNNRFVYSIMILIVTFITVFAISTFKVNYIVPTNQSAIDDTEEIQKPDGTGYIFDYDNQVNIPINSEDSR